jgi:hypothetical protein
LNEAILKYKNKKKLPDTYSLWGLSPVVGLCLNILDNGNDIATKNDTEMRLFKHTFMTNDIRVLDKIINLSEKNKEL